MTKKDSRTGQTNTWTEYQIGPTKCFGGDVTQIKNFWALDGGWGILYSILAQMLGEWLMDVFDVTFGITKQIHYDTSKTEPRGCSPLRGDYEELKPCCGSTDFWTKENIEFNTEEGKCANPKGCADPKEDKYDC